LGAPNTHLAQPRIEMESDGEGEYDVEAIVSHKKIGGTLHYEVKWEGWPSSANTWEPIDHLAKCQDMIEEFHKKARGCRKLRIRRG
jgi:Chromo (CHRromatin Organisation MOdifier) domain